MQLFIKPEQKPKIVIDTNILVSAGLGKLGHSYKIVTQISGGVVQNFTSEEILNEIHDVFNREEITSRISENDRSFLLAVYEQKSIKVAAVNAMEKIAKDSDDDKFFHCAIEAKADFLISGDKQHVLKIKKYQQIRVLSPKEFLEETKKPMDNL